MWFHCRNLFYYKQLCNHVLAGSGLYRFYAYTTVGLGHCFLKYSNISWCLDCKGLLNLNHIIWIYCIWTSFPQTHSGHPSGLLLQGVVESEELEATKKCRPHLEKVGEVRWSIGQRSTVRALCIADILGTLLNWGQINLWDLIST